MATETENLKLVKPDEEDFYDVGVQNGNMDIIDAAVSAKAEQAEFHVHTEDNAIHITEAERESWNAKQDAATAVAGVKGNTESSYRRGNVNLTPEDIGALPIDGDSKNNTVTFAQAGQRANISSGEKLSSIFGKIMKFFSDLKTVAFSGSYNDLSDTPSSLPANGGYADSAGSVAWAVVSGKPSTYTPSSHTHDERYYTETEINTKLSNMASHYRLTNKSFSIDGNGSTQVKIPYTIISGYAISGVLEVRSSTSAAVIYGYSISNLSGSGTVTVYLGNRSTNAQTGSVAVNLGISKISF